MTRNLLLLVGIVLAGGCSGQKGEERILLTVRRNYVIPKGSEKVTLVVDWKDLTRQLKLSAGKGVELFDHNFGRPLVPRYVDADGDKTPDAIAVDYTFSSTEPVFSFEAKPSSEVYQLSTEAIVRDERLVVSFLKPFHPSKGGERLAVSREIVESTIRQYPDITTFPIYAPRRWNYEYSFFLLGAHRLGLQLKEKRYTDFARSWVDDLIQEDGTFKSGIYKMEEYKLDDIMPGRITLALYESTHVPKYKSIADELMVQLGKQPKTSDGGYWHKEVYPHQMWLDGIFMADVFTTQYAALFNKPELFDEATHQVKLVYKHTLDSATGLLRHGWDESRQSLWADASGRSPEVWARAVGWYCMAIVEILDYLPADHADRPALIKILQDVSAAVLRYQDQRSGLWYQVLDKGSQKGNWIETSGSAMFAYAFAKGHRLGCLDEQYRKSAERAWQGLLDSYVYVDESSNLHLAQTVKVGTLNTKDSDGSFNYYTTTERRLDDYKGLASLLFAGMEMAR